MRASSPGLLGRDAELAGVRALLRRGPVVTVTGVGGVGKTRLAEVAAAGEAQRRVVTCELGAVEAAEAVPYAVADALGFPSLDALLMSATGEDVLLVVDNCEHVLDAAADTVTRLVHGAPGVTVLATSREALRVPDERLVPLEPLALPASGSPSDLAGSPAVQLLIERATAGGAEVDPATDADAIAALCRRLDGLPLAIELAAARMRSLTPREVLGHLDDRLALLRRAHERGPKRHRSLEAAMDWSYERLPGPTQRFFERLAVFSGRFTADLAHEVAGEPGDEAMSTLDRLDRLVGHSLLIVEQREGRSWYRLLQTVRGYARDRLARRGELDAAHRRWVDSLVATSVEVATRMLHAWPADLFVTLQNTHSDIADALRWCVARDDGPDRALPLFVPLCGLLKRRSAIPLADLGDLVLERWPRIRHERWSEVAAAAAIAHVLRGSGERGAELARLAISDGPSGLAAVNARRALYFHARSAGRHAEALRWVEEAIEVATAHGMGPWWNEQLTFRALALAALGRLAEAVDQVGAACRAAPATGSPALEAWAGAVRASLIALRDPVAGRATCQEAARRCEELDYPIGAGICLRTLGVLALRERRLAESARRLMGSLDAHVGLGYSFEAELTLRWVARLAHLAARGPAAATLWRSVTVGGADVLEESLVPTGTDAALDAALDAADAAPVGLVDAIALARVELAVIAASDAPATGAPGDADADANAEAAEGVFRLEGAVWTVSFRGATVRLPDLKGLHDLAVLLARPGREVHCAELMGAAVEQPDTGPVLDLTARRAYEARIVELQAELAEAEDYDDAGRADKLRTEMELLIAELTAATGLGGRTRRAGSGTDRVRSAVSQRIRAAIRRLAAVHPDLGRHLNGSVHTGTWCAYRPERPVAWNR